MPLILKILIIDKLITVMYITDIINSIEGIHGKRKNVLYHITSCNGR